MQCISVNAMRYRKCNAKWSCDKETLLHGIHAALRVKREGALVLGALVLGASGAKLHGIHAVLRICSQNWKSNMGQ